MVEDLDSAPQNYLKIILNLSATKILLNSDIFKNIMQNFYIYSKLLRHF